MMNNTWKLAKSAVQTSVRNSVWDSASKPLPDSVWNSVWESVGAPVGISAEVLIPIWDSAKEATYE